MRYCVGVDIGNSTVAAAVADSRGVELVGLGRQGPVIPAIAHLAPDGSVLAGEAAERADAQDPSRSARLLVRRLDDQPSVRLGGEVRAVADLVGAVLRDVLDRVTAIRRGPPDQVVLIRPTALGPAGAARLTEAAARAGRPDATTTTAAQACAEWFVGSGRFAPAGRAAFYDFGGGSFEAAVLTRGPQGVDLAGPPSGIARLGGVELDDLVRAHLDARLGRALSGGNPDRRTQAVADQRIRSACIRAKEALSAEAFTDIALELPDGVRRYVLRRGELDAVLSRPVGDTVAVLRSVAGASGGGLDAVVLAGGSARIPLVSTTIAQAMGAGVRIVRAPVGAAALGAAQLAIRPPAHPASQRGARPPGGAPPSRTDSPRDAVAAARGAGPAVPALPAPPVPPPAVPSPVPSAGPSSGPPDAVSGSSGAASDESWSTPSIGRPLAVALAVLAVLVAVAVIVFIVLNRVGPAATGLIAPQHVVEAWCRYRDLVF